LLFTKVTNCNKVYHPACAAEDEFGLMSSFQCPVKIVSQDNDTSLELLPHHNGITKVAE